MGNGYIGKILNVDLSTKRAVTIDLDKKVMRNFLGGLGLGIKILYDEVAPSVDPMSPDNIIVIATGPLSGTTAPTNGRTEVITKSPLTGIIGRGNFGGYWGPRLKLAGLEAIVVRNKSERPVYLWIENGIAQVKSAEHVWGKDSWETTDILKRELGKDVSVLAIGQGGENLVRFACPVVDYYHAPGRSHAGCVMGVKKLKAIAVRGEKEVPIADPEKFKEAVKDGVDRIVEYPERGHRLEVGSHYNIKYTVDAGYTKMGNWGLEDVPPDHDIRHLPESMQRHIVREPGVYGYHCPMAQYYGCDLMADIQAGKYRGPKLGGISFSLSGREFGITLGIKSYPAMFKCRELCQRYGIDEMTPIPFAIDLFENGIITKEDTGDLELELGNEFAIIEMLGKIAYREGLGDILAEGSVRAARKIGKGAEKYVKTIKGMEVLGGDPRIWSWAKILGCAVCPRGGDDLNTTHAFSETFPGWAREAGWSEDEYLRWWVNYLDMTEDEKREIFGAPPHTDALKGATLEGKAALTIWHERITSLCDSLGLCLMSSSIWCALGPTHMAKLYSACTGWQVTRGELMKAADRIFNLMKAYIVREGFTRREDDWPARYYKEPRQGDVFRGALLSRGKMDKILDEYYELRGWGKKAGVPTKSKLIELGLDYVADELSNRGLVQS